MQSLNDDYQVNKEENFHDGGYFDIDEAMNLVTYNQDRSLLNLSFMRFKELIAV